MLAIVLSCIAANLALFFHFPNTGWDRIDNCAAVQAVQDGHDPYMRGAVSDSGVAWLGYTYSPLVLRVLKLFCESGSTFPWIATNLVVLLVLFLQFRIRGDELYFIGLLLGAFQSAFISILTWNIAPIELLLFATSLWALLHKRPMYAGVASGLCGFIKIQPLLLAMVLAPYTGSAVSFAFAAALVFFGLQGLSWISDPTLSASYFNFLKENFLGTGQRSIGEAGIQYNPSLLNFLREAFPHPTPWGGTIGAVFFLVLALATATALLTVVRRCKYPHNLAISLLLTLLFFPRLKDYSFGLAIIPLYLLTADATQRLKTLLLIITGLTPILFFAIRTRLSVAVLTLPTPLYFIVNYYLLFCLITAVVISVRRCKNSN